ncbi:hypothetical protein OA92_15355 [Marinomonas sp. SBI22]|uniref:hypothetical protein n=1 Tax=unclassified Marinomonas TaxID=196814 RepID=UPI0007AF8453|nr:MULTISPECIES: hypothetical protein [unclassified Marinomonas]KZM40954.1 hypothetical protein OA92_15355 [Marinomonas sp. SBI22]KZM42794.1 hypothetical protein OA91_13560 [Marinomonas sp. SBI8L]
MSEILDAISALGDATADMTLAKESFETVRQDAEQAISDHLSEADAHNQYVKTDTFEQVKKLPIYPEVMSDDNRLAMTLDSSVLTIEANQIIRLYGWLEINTSDYAVRTFSINDTKTYHLRFNLTDGFYLKDLSDIGYNPDSFDESDRLFDTNYDDMNLALIFDGFLMRCIHTNQLSKTALFSGDGSIVVPLCPRLRRVCLLFSNLEASAGAQKVSIPAEVDKGGHGYFYSTNSNANNNVWSNSGDIRLDTNNVGSDTTISINHIIFSPRLQRFQTSHYITELDESNVHEFLLRGDKGECLAIWKEAGMTLNYVEIASANITVEYLR